MPKPWLLTGAKIARVAEPKTVADVKRILRLGTLLCDDEFVFRLAWVWTLHGTS